MNTQTLINELQAQGKKLRTTTTSHALRGGCAVIFTSHDAWTSTIVKPYSLAIVEGGPSPCGLGEGVAFTFNYTAYKDGYCSVSGGPGTIHTPVECLQFTGLLRRCWCFPLS